MNKRIILSVLLLALPCLGAHAQAPDGTVLLGPEWTTVTATTGTNVVYKFGIDTRINTVPSPVVYPLIADCSVLADCNTMGGDPAPSVTKNLYAVEQATPYTVTLAGSPTPVTVPANPALAATPPPTPTPPAPPVPPACPIPPPCINCAFIPMPANPAKCPLAAGATAIATDGQMAMITSQSAPVYMQYCQGSTCNPPIQFTGQQLIVGSYSPLGGLPGTGIGTLYILPSPYFVGVAVAQGPITTIPIAGTNVSK